MQGRVLGYDESTGQWQVAGSDGQRYDLGTEDWRSGVQPYAGQQVDFQPVDGRATSVFQLGPAPDPAGPGVPGGKSRIAAALLALFLGSLGVHKFYLGRNTAGVIMLLCTIPFGFFVLPWLVVGVIAFIECIIYLTMSDGDFERTYVQGDKSWF